MTAGISSSDPEKEKTKRMDKIISKAFFSDIASNMTERKDTPSSFKIN